MSEEVTLVTMRERVKVLKVDLDNPEKEPEVVEQETVSKISLDDAALLGFVPGQGFNPLPPYQDTYTVAESNQAWNEFTRDADGPPPPVDGVRVGDQ